MTQPQKRVMIGKPLDLNAEALDQAATVTTVDTIMAKALWQRFSPPRYVDLLDALADDFIGAT